MPQKDTLGNVAHTSVLWTISVARFTTRYKRIFARIYSFLDPEIFYGCRSGLCVLKCDLDLEIRRQPTING